MFQHHSLARNLFSMTWPMLLGVLALMSFQLVDSFFISLLGTEPLAALGFTMPINQLMVGVQIGMGIAATALISRALGANEPLYAKRLSALVVLLGCSLMAIMMLVVFLLEYPILHALGANKDVFLYTDSYWLPWLISSWSHALLYFGTSLCRANGDTKLPGLIMVATSLLNMVLDPIFIFVLDFGIAGAAYATTAASALSSLILFSRVYQRGWLSFDVQNLNVLSTLLSIGNIGLPAMLSQLMPGMAALLATRIVAVYGSAAIAAWALGTRLEFFSIIVVLALTMSMPPMLGHMLGSKKLDQAQQLIKIAVRFIILLQLMVAAFWWILRPWMVSALTQDTSTALYLSSYIIWVPASYSALGVCILMVSVCNALGMPMRAVTISVVRLFLCYLPALALGAYLADMEGIYYGVLVGNVFAGLSAWWMFQKGFNNLMNNRVTA